MTILRVRGKINSLNWLLRRPFDKARKRKAYLEYSNVFATPSDGMNRRRKCEFIFARALTSQKGFSILTALFILLVLAGLGAFMVTMSGVQSRTSLWALQGARAYHAARSGLEWGGFQALVNNSCNASTTFSVDGFTVTLACQSEGPITEGAQSYSVFHLTSLAEWETYGSAEYISRQLTSRVTSALP